MSSSASTTIKRRKCSFIAEWETLYDFVKPSRKGNGYFYCTFCDKDINVETMGVSAVKSHNENRFHRQIAVDNQKAAALAEENCLRRRLFQSLDLEGTDAAPEAIVTAFVTERKPIDVSSLSATKRLFERGTETPSPTPPAKKERIASAEGGDDDDDVVNVSDFVRKKQLIDLQILEAELIEKQLSNYQRCTELGLPACRIESAEGGDDDDDVVNVSDFVRKKQLIDLQILEAELIEKQLSNYQRCTELGLPACIHLPVGTGPRRLQQCRRFITFSNPHACQFDAERQRADVPPRDGNLNESVGTSCCELTAFADI
uniref:BED-type domain-containing protein n=1 Tax=Globodera pallida TaxID=36090 RepID=A0A183C740_GLOPA